MAFAHKLFTSLQNYSDPDTRIGELNRIWYDSINNVFRIQLDTTTAGGTVIGGAGGGSYTLPVATASILGGVKIGSNITINAGVISVAAPFSGSYNDLTSKPDLSVYYLASNPNGYTANTGTVTTVSGSGTVSGLSLSGSVSSSGSLTLGGTLSLTSGNVTTALGFTPYNATNPNNYITNSALTGYATESYVGQQVSNLVASAPSTLDTLNELATALGSDSSFATTVSTALGNRLRVDIDNQTLNTTQKTNARTNLGLATVASSGSYNDLSNTPSLFSGSYTDLSNKPDLSVYYLASNPSSYISGNQSITVSGDISGSGTTSITTTLATVNSNVGTFGSFTDVPVITVNAKGLITGVTTSTTPSETNVYYVTKIGSDTNNGRRLATSFLTIAKALSVATTGETVYIQTGTYVEVFPLVLPAGVNIRGAGLREVTINPTNGTKSNDGLLLSGESTVSDFTIGGQLYNSGANTGYAFRYQSGAVITSRSPYIERITVLQRGSVTSATDPYGYIQGDAGRGVLIDGSQVTRGSIEAAMLFNEATFIVPNSRALIMTNGARSEWLNCFTYFAELAIEGVVGATGRAGSGRTYITLTGLSGSGFTVGETVRFTAQDTTVTNVVVVTVSGSKISVAGRETVLSTATTYTSITGLTSNTTATGISRHDVAEFGAELRAIASANVYGSRAVKADGVGVTLQLMAHNFAYIGTGADLSNDKSAVVTANEAIEVNGGRIYYNSVDQTGNFRVGSLFNVNFETGSVSFAGPSFDVTSLTGITFTDGANTSIVNPLKVQTGNLVLAGNTLSSISGGITVDPNGSETITLNSNTTVVGTFNASSISIASVVQSQAVNNLTDLQDVTITGTPTNGYVLKYNSSTGQWEPSAYSSGLTYTDFSIGTANAASGSGAISYNDTTGVFKYTPPDLSSYLTGITSGQVTTALGYTPYNATNPSGYTSNTGTVTSIATAGSVSGLTLTGGTITTTGTITLGGTLAVTASNFGTQNANYVLAGPLNGAAATPTFRALTSADIPSLSYVSSVSGTGSVSGLTLTGTVTSTGSLTLGGTLSLTSSDVTTALGYTPYNSTNPNSYITASALVGYATETYVGTAISNLVASSPATLDTLNELASALGNDPNFATTVSTSLGNRLRIDVDTQGLSGTQKQNGRTNLGLATVASSGSYTDLTSKPDLSVYYLATNPSGYTANTGTVTSVSALTLGTTGTDLTSTVATGTTTPVITLNVPTASSLNRGALSSTDWSTFNGKQEALVSGTSIKTINSTTLLGSGNISLVLARSTSVFSTGTAQTYTAPADTEWVKVTVVGPGGNAGAANNSRATGGGGGGVAIKWLSITPGQTLIYTVGTASGTASTVASGTLTITTISGGSGANGATTAYAASATAGATGGVASGGDVNIAGGLSGTSYGSSTTLLTNFSGKGGDCPGFGTGGQAVGCVALAGTVGNGFGAGAGGSNGINTSVSGRGGVIIFEAY